MNMVFIRWLVNTIAIMLAIKFVPGLNYTGEWWGILLVGVIFGLVNAVIRPFVKLLTLPFLILTLGLFTFITNALMLNITAWLSGKLHIGFYVAGFSSAFWGALIISFVSMALSCLLPSEENQRIH